MNKRVPGKRFQVPGENLENWEYFKPVTHHSNVFRYPILSTQHVAITVVFPQLAT